MKTSTLQSLLSFVTLVITVNASPLQSRSAALKAFPTGGKFDYQIGGSYSPVSDVQIVSRDNGDKIAAGKYNICYLNAFQTQPADKDFWVNQHNDLVLKKNGKPFEDKDWPGEFFLDTSTDAKRQAIATIHKATIDACASKGFDAIEPDNLDTFTRSSGLLTQDNNLQLAKILANYAHGKGLAFAQKNTGGDIGSAGKSVAGFDFAIAEECSENKECDSYTDVYGAAVLEIEYKDAPFNSACTAKKNGGPQLSIIRRDREVVPSGTSGYVYKTC